MATIIDRLYEDHRALLDYLEQRNEVSLRSNADDHLRKVLLLSAASYFESLIKDSISTFVAERLGDADPILEFVKNKAIERQYHTYFNWSARNANAFFGLFGSGFRDFMAAEVQRDQPLGEAIRAFLELGELRNQLVHQNFASFPLEKTAKEIYELSASAQVFVDALPRKLREYVAQISP